MITKTNNSGWVYSDFEIVDGIITDLTLQGKLKAGTKEFIQLPQYDMDGHPTKNYNKENFSDYLDKLIFPKNWVEQEDLLKWGINDFSYDAKGHVTGFSPLGACKINSGAPGITFPRTVTHIMSDSFKNIQVDFIRFEKGSRLEHISSHAFCSCEITELDFSECINLKNISDYAFEGCPVAKLIISNLPELEKIGHKAFNLAELELFDISGCPLLWFIGNNAIKNIEYTPVKKSGSLSLTKAPFLSEW